MGIKMKNTSFWSVVLTPGEYDFYVKGLYSKGVILTVDFTKIIALSKEGGTILSELSLPINTTAIVKLSPKNAILKSTITPLIVEFLTALLSADTVFHTPPSVIATSSYYEFPTEALIHHNHMHIGGGGVNPTPVATTTVNLNTNVTLPWESEKKLKDATGLGQKVKGSSLGSVYTVIAIGNSVNIAARLVGNVLSIRAEPRNQWTTEEVTAVQQQGMCVKGNYASMHMSCINVPPGRVLGAFLTDVDIKFENQLTHMKDFKWS